MSPKPIDVLIGDYHTFIGELELVIDHARTCITHAENGELARVGAHGFAAAGHLIAAEDINRRIAQGWATHSVP